MTHLWKDYIQTFDPETAPYWINDINESQFEGWWGVVEELQGGQTAMFADLENAQEHVLKLCARPHVIKWSDDCVSPSYPTAFAAKIQADLFVDMTHHPEDHTFVIEFLEDEVAND